MNNDRLLTRVWDKHNQEMYYAGDKTKYGIFLGVNEDGVLFESDYVDYGDFKTSLILEPFNDRFIPMQCMGRKDKNDKLFYQHDIVKTDRNCLCTVEIDESISAFVFQLIGDDICKFCCSTLTIRRAEIIGNRWENPELLKEDMKC
jgi:hypothetical protein